jgi:subtilisin
MARAKYLLGGLLFLSLAASHAVASSPASTSRYIVVLRQGVPSPQLASAHAAAFDLEIHHVYRFALNGYSATMTHVAADALEADPDVLWVERDRRVRAAGQTLPTGVDRVEADENPKASIDGTDTRVDADIAVLDTGVDPSHPDLHVAGGTNCVSPGVPFTDANGHGTHVAGTAAALDNGVGVVGVAPGARLWGIKVLSDAGVGLSSASICGIDWAVGHGGIEVINMSLIGGGREYPDCGRGIDAQHQAVCRAVASGIAFAVAAGNESVDAATRVPAAYDEVITVSALSDLDGKAGGVGKNTCTRDRDDAFASYSNFGQDVDLIAPGTCIYSTYAAGRYALMNGTSMATPHVSGAIALYRATHPGATPTQVKTALLGAATDDWEWPTAQDPDGIKEPLLRTAAL